jgi:hypothetical protein
MLQKLGLVIIIISLYCWNDNESQLPSVSLNDHWAMLPSCTMVKSPFLIILINKWEITQSSFNVWHVKQLICCFKISATRFMKDILLLEIKDWSVYRCFHILVLKMTNRFFTPSLRRLWNSSHNLLMHISLFNKLYTFKDNRLTNTRIVMWYDILNHFSKTLMLIHIIDLQLGI